MMEGLIRILLSAYKEMTKCGTLGMASKHLIVPRERDGVRHGEMLMKTK